MADTVNAPKVSILSIFLLVIGVVEGRVTAQTSFSCRWVLPCDEEMNFLMKIIKKVFFPEILNEEGRESLGQHNGTVEGREC